MKVTVVPAQITTIEDRIAGSLGLSQLMLLAVPIFGGAALYIILPPLMHGALYKIMAIILLAIICGILAIRIKGKIILFWLVIIFRYRWRPAFYIYNKNDLANREQYRQVKEDQAETKVVSKSGNYLHRPSLSIAELAKVQLLIENPATNLAFQTNKKGGINVLFSEIQE